MNLILIKIIFALLTFITTNPNIPQATVDQAIATVTSYSSQIQAVEGNTQVSTSTPVSAPVTDTSSATPQDEASSDVSSQASDVPVEPTDSPYSCAVGVWLDGSCQTYTWQTGIVTHYDADGNITGTTTADTDHNVGQ